jgi:Phosphatidylglycerol lysyltransferase, C-terminal
VPRISRDEAFGKFLEWGHNSSHFVWFLTEMQFYRCGNGWIFAFVQKGAVTLVALEPLHPPVAGEDVDESGVKAAWSEFESEIHPKITFFVSIYGPFFKQLRKLGFQALQVGREPYVDLSDCVPTGKSGKGVRAARNQALRAGVKVEEWTGKMILGHPQMVGDMRRLLKTWKSRNIFDMSGFLNVVDPFQEMEHRRYFIATSEKQGLEAFLVATPIPGRNSYFLEDMVVRPGATRGTGELLTLESLVALAESKAAMASLGVVALTHVDKSCSHGLPPSAELAFVTLPKYANKIYNVEGLEMFRKRFKPKRWESIYLCLKNSPQSGVSDGRAWFLAFFALLSCFRPRLNFSLEWLKGFLARLWWRHPITWVVLGLSTLSFGLINKGGNLPNWALNRFGFVGTAPFHEWPLRSVVSDLLFFDRWHYIGSMLALYILVRWMERTHTQKFVVWTVVLMCFFDDFINQLVLISPYSYFHPKIFEHLVAVKDVGPSLWIAAFLGLQLCTMKRNRELLFSLFVAASLLSFAFESSHFTGLVLNLNHTLFLVFGYVLGKVEYERQREVSRSVAKQKPPVAKSVAQPQPRKSQQQAKEAGLAKGAVEPPAEEPV